MKKHILSVLCLLLVASLAAGCVPNEVLYPTQNVPIISDASETPAAVESHDQKETANETGVESETEATPDASSEPQQEETNQAEPQTETDPVVRRAVVTAQGEYSSALSVLSPATENDARCVADIFSRSDGFESVKLLLNAECDTKEKIKSAVSEAFANADENDVSYFYYSGHGGVDEYGDSYLAYDGCDIYAEDILEILSTVRGNVIVVLDCCFSGGILGKGVAKQFVSYIDEYESEQTVWESTAVTKPNFYIITASSSEETSLQSSVGGCFTYALSMGCGVDPRPLKANSTDYDVYAADINRDGTVTIAEVESYISAMNRMSYVQIYPAQSDFAFIEYTSGNAPDVVVNNIDVEYGADTKLNITFDTVSEQNAKVEILSMDYDTYFYSLYCAADKSYTAVDANVLEEHEYTLKAGKTEETITLGKDSFYSSWYVLRITTQSQQQSTIVPFIVNREYMGNTTITLDGADTFMPGDGNEYELRVAYDGYYFDSTLPNVVFDCYLTDLQGVRICTLADSVLGESHVEGVDYEETWLNYNNFYFDGKINGEYISAGEYRIRVDAHFGAKVISRTQKITIEEASDSTLFSNIYVDAYVNVVDEYEPLRARFTVDSDEEMIVSIYAEDNAYYDDTSDAAADSVQSENDDTQQTTEDTNGETDDSQIVDEEYTDDYETYETLVREIRVKGGASINEIEWDYKDEKGNYVYSGEYRIGITLASDEDYAYEKSQYIYVITDTLPLLSEISIYRSDIYEIQVGFDVSNPASVNLYVVDSNGDTIKTFMDDVSCNAGVYSFTWDMRDDNGDLVFPGEQYTFIAESENEIGEYDSTQKDVQFVIYEDAKKCELNSLSADDICVDDDYLCLDFEVSEYYNLIIRIYDSNGKLAAYSTIYNYSDESNYAEFDGYGHEEIEISCENEIFPGNLTVGTYTIEVTAFPVQAEFNKVFASQTLTATFSVTESNKMAK